MDDLSLERYCCRATFLGQYSITLTTNSQGDFQYDTDDFHPIDDALYGNEGDPHNYFFTFTIDAMFQYDACADQYFSFEGDDDVWIFVDHQLVMHIGGINPATTQHLQMDRLGLKDGEFYSFQIFHAQRQTLSSRFKLKTSVAFVSPEQTVMLTGPFD